MPTLWRQRQDNLWVYGQPRLHINFQASQGYIVGSCLFVVFDSFEKEFLCVGLAGEIMSLKSLVVETLVGGTDLLASQSSHNNVESGGKRHSA